MTHQTRRRLTIGLIVGGFALVLGAIPLKAQTVIGLGPSSSGSVTIVFNGTGNPIDVTLPSVLSGTGYEFNSGGTATDFGPGSSDLTPFTSSDQGTTLSLGAGTPTPVTWVDIGGGALPGILVLQFTTPDQYPGTYDDLILNITSGSQPYIDAVPPSTFGGGNPAYPDPVSNICDPSINCFYDGLVGDSSTTPTSYSLCGFPETSICTNGPILLNPTTATADVSSGEVLLETPLPAPEPHSFLLIGSGLLALFVVTKFKALTA
jgi:hypothetical protein